MSSKRILLILSIATVMLLFATVTGRCKIPPKTPGDTLCKAEMTPATIEKFQALLKLCGHDLLIMEGTLYATVKQAKQHTFVAVLKCRDDNGNLYCVGVRYLKNNFAGIEVKSTGEKCTGM